MKLGNLEINGDRIQQNKEHDYYIYAAAAAAAKSLQSCLTLCDPIDGSPPGSPSLGFSRQEHWSGFPFPSPMHESEKSKWSCLVVSDPQRPHGLQPARLFSPWDSPGKNTGVGCHALLQGIFLTQGSNLQFLTCLPTASFFTNCTQLSVGFSRQE